MFSVQRLILVDIEVHSPKFLVSDNLYLFSLSFPLVIVNGCHFGYREWLSLIKYLLCSLYSFLRLVFRISGTSRGASLCTDGELETQQDRQLAHSNTNSELRLEAR